MHQELLTNLGYKNKLRSVDDAIIKNGDFLREIVDTVGSNMFGDDSDEEHEAEDEAEDEGRESKDVDNKVADAPHPFDVADGSSGDDSDDYEDSTTPLPPHAGHSHDGPSSSHSHDHAHSHSRDTPGPSPAAKDDNLFKSSKAEFKKVPNPSDHDMDKLRSTLKQYAREVSRPSRTMRRASRAWLTHLYFVSSAVLFFVPSCSL